jgi:succinoglycan biosynthesis protein ExoA
VDHVTASVIIATLNEETNIGHVLDTALRERAVVEVIVADGGSEDATVESVLGRAEDDQRVRLIRNPHGGQAAGLNQAADAATGTILIRLDGHTRYADDYVRSSIAAWSPGIAAGGPMLAEGTTMWGQATARAMRDPLAIGPARFHHAAAVESVDTVYLGTFERDTFLRLGGYRTFPSGTVEDTDLYTRWRSDGGSVVVDPSIVSWYHPRDSWRGLARQYFRYGLGKSELVWINGRLPSLRPMAPALLIAGLTTTAIIGGVSTWMPFMLVASAWLAVLAVVGARAGGQRVRTAAVTATMHGTYGIGLWWGLVTGRPRVRTLGLTADPDPSPETPRTI